MKIVYQVYGISGYLQHIGTHALVLFDSSKFKITGLNPSVQQDTEVPSSFIQGKVSTEHQCDYLFVYVVPSPMAESLRHITTFTNSKLLAFPKNAAYVYFLSHRGLSPKIWFESVFFTTVIFTLLLSTIRPPPLLLRQIY